MPSREDFAVTLTFDFFLPQNEISSCLCPSATKR